MTDKPGSKSERISSDSNNNQELTAQCKSVNVKRGNQTLTMFFSRKSEQKAQEKKGPLEPAKQRDIPKVKQGKPRVICSSSEEKKEELSKVDLPFQSTELATDERTTPPVQEVQQSMNLRDDAVDVMLQDHTKEVDSDMKTNPVEQNKKRVLRKEDDVSFLQNDSTAEPKKFGQ